MTLHEILPSGVRWARSARDLTRWTVTEQHSYPGNEALASSSR